MLCILLFYHWCWSGCRVLASVAASGAPLLPSASTSPPVRGALLRAVVCSILYGLCPADHTVWVSIRCMFSLCCVRPRLCSEVFDLEYALHCVWLLSVFTVDSILWLRGIVKAGHRLFSWSSPPYVLCCLPFLCGWLQFYLALLRSYATVPVSARPVSCHAVLQCRVYPCEWS